MRFSRAIGCVQKGLLCVSRGLLQLLTLTKVYLTLECPRRGLDQQLRMATALSTQERTPSYCRNASIYTVSTQPL